MGDKIQMSVGDSHVVLVSLQEEAKSKLGYLLSFTM